MICPYGGSLIVNQCVSAPPCPSSKVRDAATGACVPNPKNLGPSDSCSATPTTPNPITLGTGNKYLVETAYVGTGSFPLFFSRVYNSADTGWRNNPSGRSISLGTNGTTATVQRGTGKSLVFTQSGTTWVTDTDTTDKLVKLASGWTYTNASDEIEMYNSTGYLSTIKDRRGLTQTYTYSDGTTGTNGGYVLDANGNPTTTVLPAGLMIRIADASNRALNFGRDSSSRIVKLTDPAGGNYLYGYDANNNLVSVTYPDGSIRQYGYNEQDKTGNTNQPHTLTGITDKQNSSDPGTRYASYWYDAQGRAVKEEHAPDLALNIDKYSLTYNTDATGNPTNTVVTDPLNSARTYNFTTILGVVKSTGTNQPGGSGCGAASSALTYDANGNVTSRADFNQHKTCYAYDTQGRNLETARVEGLNSGDVCATALAATTLSGDTRKISTQWHAYWRLPVKVAEPKRLTTWVYNGDIYQGVTVSCAPAGALIGTQPIGVLCKKIIQATIDSTGVQGLSATIDSTIAARIWSYTYDGNGQVLTADGPRTDVADITTYTYYSTDDTTVPTPKYRHGDLWKITNALSQTTQITSYDGNGRPLTLIDPNTVTTTLAYWPRGWLKSKTVGSKTTSYDYDNVGQLKYVTLADGSYIDYTYDAAHRLTDITDRLLNRIHYTLDAIGNRTLEEVFDANSVLSTKKGRDFDALNRLWHDIAYFNDPNTQIKTQYTYDANGNLTTITPPANSGTDTTYRTTTFYYDALNRLAGVFDPVNTTVHPTQYGYDGIDQVKTITDPRNLTTSYTLNAL